MARLAAQIGLNRDAQILFWVVVAVGLSFFAALQLSQPASNGVKISPRDMFVATPINERFPDRVIAPSPDQRLSNQWRLTGPVQIHYPFEHNTSSEQPRLLHLPASAPVRAYLNGVRLEQSQASPGSLFWRGAADRQFILPEAYYLPGRNRLDLIYAGTRFSALPGQVVLSNSATSAGPPPGAVAPDRAILAFVSGFAVLSAALAIGAALWSPKHNAPPWIAAGLLSLGVWGLAMTAPADALDAPLPLKRAIDGAILIGMMASLSALIRLRLGPVAAWGSRARQIPLTTVGLGLSTIILAVSTLGMSGLAATPGVAVLGQWLTLVSILLLASLGFAATRASLQQAVRQGRDALSTERRMAAQRAKLAETQTALEDQLAYRAVLEERQRLARDMHDGVGGQLASLHARLRSDPQSPPHVERAVADSLVDLRLIVDSLDSVGEELGDALDAFRDRIEPELNVIGLELIWSRPDERAPLIASPTRILSIYRWLQEAVTNVIRHAGASSITVEIRYAEGRLTLEVRDDGVGFKDSGRVTGSGMRNMARRALQLGAQFDVSEASAQGAWVRLVIPFDENPP